VAFSSIDPLAGTEGAVSQQREGKYERRERIEKMEGNALK